MPEARRVDRPPTALVTDAGRGSAISIIRSLGRKGWCVVAADQSPTSPGFRSRYAGQTLVYPSPRASSDDFVAAILAGARHHEVDLVVPVTDDALHPLAARRQEFAGVSRLAIAEPDALARVCNKERTLELARALGVPTPRTLSVRTVAEAERRAADLTWPVVVKPESSRHYDACSGRLDACAVSYARDLDQLVAQVRRADGRYALLLQEYRGGEGVGVEILAQDGRPLLAFQHRRLAEVPITGGASAWRESMPLDSELYDYARRLVGALKWTGPIMVEFKGGERPALMEINGRVWGSMPLAVMSGVDFPSAWAELCMDPTQSRDMPPPTYEIGVRAYDLDHLLLWIGNVLLGRRRFAFLPVPPRRAAFRALAALASRSQRWDFASRDDPGPALAELRRIPARFARRLLGRTANDG
ncbi:MAG: ATP-grasp domain-containing protein [Deltaproteobacteria bacterium]|nr:ATP-grasp domain-containing protein [Deltaproteobacteria bacterium]MBW2360805.1 ATP-grasp domain-containing protein [Deltaproteobacteria bacterium]